MDNISLANVELRTLKAVQGNLNDAKSNLANFARELVGCSILFKRGKKHTVFSDIVGSEGTRLLVCNRESKAAYYVDLTKTEVLKIVPSNKSS